MDNSKDMEHRNLRRWLVQPRAQKLMIKKTKLPFLPASQVAILIILFYDGELTRTGLRKRLLFFGRGAQETFIDENIKALMVAEMIVRREGTATSRYFTYSISIVGKNYLNTFEKYMTTTRLEK